MYHTLLIAEDDLDQDFEILNNFSDKPGQAGETGNSDRLSDQQGEGTTGNHEAGPSWYTAGCIKKKVYSWKIFP